AALAGVLARRPGDGRASEGLRTLETGELEHLFTAAAFEEGKILSTRTLGLARETVSVQEALAAGDAAMARERAEALSPGHPYRIAAIELARALAEHPEWRDSLDRHIKALACHGRLVLASLQAEATASWCDVGKDELERWTLGPESSLRPGESLSLLVGEYLVRVRHRGNEFRFDCLVERGKTWTVEGKTVPDEVPEGFVWIPASPFYVGEIGSNRRRYRRCQEVKRPFFIGRTEVTWKEYLGWLRTVPREDWKDLVPVYTHPVLTSEVVGEDGEVIPWLRPLADDRFPVWGITQPAALRFCQEHCGSAGSSGDLPAEFEWELAARGIAGRAFSFGDRSFPGAANIERQSGGPIPWTVSDEPAEDKSIFGVSGMCGNVSEWTHTRFADEIVIAKGGSWSSEAGRACPSNRMAFFQNKQFPYAGFRAAMYSRGE
ncbi:MAG: SUMF1/EgtB/PvdO family nonheme iron enzyme, partial [Planctomycetes bacterium]|nr:SUMF1/EgtB/PvdO family nonheme iron enzyme [Planctomycetota bacterium]